MCDGRLINRTRGGLPTYIPMIVAFLYLVVAMDR
jgi:hypothetical protein